MEALMTIIEFGTRTVTLNFDSKIAVVDWLPELARLTAEELVKKGKETDSDDFTSSPSATPIEDEDYDGAEEEENEDV